MYQCFVRKCSVKHFVKHISGIYYSISVNQIRVVQLSYTNINSSISVSIYLRTYRLGFWLMIWTIVASAWVVFLGFLLELWTLRIWVGPCACRGDHVSVSLSNYLHILISFQLHERRERKESNETRFSRGDIKFFGSVKNRFFKHGFTGFLFKSPSNDSDFNGSDAYTV